MGNRLLFNRRRFDVVPKRSIGEKPSPKNITTCYSPGFDKGGQRRSFGWDMSAWSRPDGLSDKTILHSGWTGQTVCVDPENRFVAVVLSSRTGDHEKARQGRARIISAMFGK
ncbi:MAG: serine hydrolase [Bacilli bacterium]